MPRAPKKCGRDGCETRVVGVTYCDQHQVESGKRISRHQRGYGNEHDRRVASLRKAAEATGQACWLCDKPIDYSLRKPHPLSLAAHHLTRDRSGPLVPTHKVCNERAGQPDR